MDVYVSYSSNVPVFVVRGSRLGTLRHFRSIKGHITVAGPIESKMKFINYDPVNNRDVDVEITSKN